MTRLALSHSHHGRPASQHILDHERQQPRQQQNDRHTFHVAGGARGFAAQAQEQGPAAERQGAPSSHKHSAHRRVTYDYENPIEYGCHAYEADVRIDGIPGSFCSPSCSRTVPCSTNLPPDTTAAPECVLEFPGDTAPSMCALVCTPGANQCPLNASCKSISPGMGLSRRCGCGGRGGGRDSKSNMEGRRREGRRLRRGGSVVGAVVALVAAVVTVMVVMEADTAWGREFQQCEEGEVCIGTACFVLEGGGGIEGYHLPCSVCRCVPREGGLLLHPLDRPPCPLEKLRPKWVFYKNMHHSMMFPTRCQMNFYNQTHLWQELQRRNGMWIAMVGDSLIRSVFASLLDLFLPGPVKEYTSFEKDVYHLDHLICCRAPDDCVGEIRTDPDAVFTDMVQRHMRHSGVSCITWQWGRYADDDLIKATARLAASSPAPAAIVVNPGIHGLLPGSRFIKELDGMERFLKLCGRLGRQTQCIVQTTAHTGYNRTDAVTYKHLRLRQYIAAYNAGVIELIHAYGTAKYVDAGRLSRSPLIRATMSGDRLHFLKDPVIFGPVIAQSMLNLLVSPCDDCLTVEALENFF
ncbi:hypothetical protein PTSG_08302 [Salpingoeca rosetta]|uniref:SGNH domain-containing protein n=1 Tax=Salpingoeca rosetta (strain ATCC 50818 / BSB-021) TaxID=946362 RepID=F2UJB1_SALR5|nr:uncharacterized protein PTSG_08302 [Salpingoeca rosetta]EGD77210.1 hypothetical protein PTSG_08302 [Salpingoeca rosetta]|eukprot:XP_004990554.1 hypothetical protein PTSG_08302 [Salpingoeca rosetta]